jgi:hypothetical protein
MIEGQVFAELMQLQGGRIIFIRIMNELLRLVRLNFLDSVFLI